MKTYTIPEVAEMLSVSVESVRRFLKRGTLKGSKIGGQWRVTDEQIKEFYDKNSNEHMKKAE